MNLQNRVFFRFILFLLIIFRFTYIFDFSYCLRYLIFSTKLIESFMYLALYSSLSCMSLDEEILYSCVCSLWNHHFHNEATIILTVPLLIPIKTRNLNLHYNNGTISITQSAPLLLIEKEFIARGFSFITLSFPNSSKSSALTYALFFSSVLHHCMWIIFIMWIFIASLTFCWKIPQN